MAQVKIACPHCGAEYELDEQSVGMRAECAGCGVKFVVALPVDVNVESHRRTIVDAERVWSGTIAPGFTPELSIRPPSARSQESSPTVSPRNVSVATSSLPSSSSCDIIQVSLLGSGAMGKVHRCRQLSVDRHVAAKTLEESIAADAFSRDSFIREALVTASLEHPNIVPVHELASDDNGQLLYLMKELRGKSWEHVMKSKSLDENIDILLKVCDGLAYAHSKGIIHRDIKPANVMIAEFGEVSLVDWGLAASVPGSELADKAHSVQSAAGMAGTPAYMAPEMANCDYHAMGCGTDVYLLGAVLFEILVGRAPHDSNDVYASLAMAMNNGFVDHSSAPKDELMDIALKAMATSPGGRHESVIAFQDAVRARQAHKASVAITEKAAIAFDDAKTELSYEKFTLARTAYIQALKIWPENEVAAEGIVAATEAFAQLAMSKGDLNMASYLLNATSGVSEKLKCAVSEAKTSIDSKAKIYKYLQIVAVVCFLFGLSFIYQGIRNFYYYKDLIAYLNTALTKTNSEYSNKKQLACQNFDNAALLAADVFPKQAVDMSVFPPKLKELAKCETLLDYSILYRLRVVFAFIFLLTCSIVTSN